MKTALVTICLLFASSAYGQNVSSAMSYGLTGPTSGVQFITHPEHASQQEMAPTQNLLVTSGYVSATGERPLWEVAPVHQVVPLGDMARMLKKEHETAKKAKIVWEN